MENSKKIRIQKDGPYCVSADIPLEKEFAVADKNNDPLDWKKGEGYETKGEYSLCRCGKSRNKPFCDGAHEKVGFDGTETASKEKYATQAETLPGEDLDLKDASSFCARARFCHRRGGTWKLTQQSGNPESKKIAIEEACNCSAGRLTAVDKKTGKPIEPDFSPSISVTEDIPAGVSGPLWVKGGIEVESSDGSKYEARNRQTLCRCGKSKNKPFCDGSHIDIGFDDRT